MVLVFSHTVTIMEVQLRVCAEHRLLLSAPGYNLTFIAVIAGEQR